MSPDVPIMLLIISVPKFFILRWVLKRFIRDEKIRNWNSFVGTMVISPILLIGLVIAFLSYMSYEPKYDFKKQRWFADKNARFEMRDDLVNSRILIGKSKSGVIALIGKSETNDSTEIWTCNLGISGAGFGWQFNSLQLTFENGKFSDVQQHEIID